MVYNNSTWHVWACVFAIRIVYCSYTLTRVIFVSWFLNFVIFSHHVTGFFWGGWFHGKLHWKWKHHLNRFVKPPIHITWFGCKISSTTKFRCVLFLYFRIKCGYSMFIWCKYDYFRLTGPFCVDEMMAKTKK